MTKQNAVEGRQRETKKNKPGNHDEPGSSRLETKGDKRGIMTKQDPVQDPLEARQRETNPEIMTRQDPVEGRQRETNLEITTKQDPVDGRQRETNLEIMAKQDPVEGDKGGQARKS